MGLLFLFGSARNLVAENGCRRSLQVVVGRNKPEDAVTADAQHVFQKGNFADLTLALTSKRPLLCYGLLPWQFV